MSIVKKIFSCCFKDDIKNLQNKKEDFVTLDAKEYFIKYYQSYNARFSLNQLTHTEKKYLKNSLKTVENLSILSFIAGTSKKTFNLKNAYEKQEYLDIKMIIESFIVQNFQEIQKHKDVTKFLKADKEDIRSSIYGNEERSSNNSTIKNLLEEMVSHRSI